MKKIQLMIFDDDDLNLAQKVQAPHKLIMVHQHRIEPGFAVHPCTLAPSPSILILSPTAPCRVCCTTSPPGITLRFTPSPPAPCVPSPPLLALALHFLAHNEKRRMPVRMIMVTWQQKNLHISLRFPSGQRFHKSADILTRRL